MSSLIRRCADTPPQLLIRGIQEFNRGEYFECHETLEEIWRAERDFVRLLYKGILQVGVGLYHLRRGKYHAALAKLASGIRLLKPFAPRCMGVEVELLITQAERGLQELERLGPRRMAEFDASLAPRIEVATSKARQHLD